MNKQCYRKATLSINPNAFLLAYGVYIDREMVLAGVDEVARLVGVQQPRLKGHILHVSLKNEYNLWLKKMANHSHYSRSGKRPTSATWIMLLTMFPSIILGLPIDNILSPYSFILIHS